eukprot:5593224-Pleurochrysis_carterae.AAC.1
MRLEAHQAQRGEEVNPSCARTPTHTHACTHKHTYACARTQARQHARARARSVSHTRGLPYVVYVFSRAASAAEDDPVATERGDLRQRRVHNARTHVHARTHMRSRAHPPMSMVRVDISVSESAFCGGGDGSGGDGSGGVDDKSARRKSLFKRFCMLANRLWELWSWSIILAKYLCMHMYMCAYVRSYDNVNDDDAFQNYVWLLSGASGPSGGGGGLRHFDCACRAV